MGFLKEFKEFAMRGNVMDLAVAVILGKAFGDIVTAMTEKILMPVIGSFIKSDFEKMQITINDVSIKYGAFIQATVNFILIALFIFILIKIMNSFKKPQAPAPPAGPSSTDQLLMEIRDALKK